MSAVASISNRVGDLGDYLREQREHARLSLRQLATLAGVSNPYLSQVERGLRKPSAEVLQQIARGLRISAEALYVRAGILEEDVRPDVEAAVHADPGLNDRQKRVLLDIYAAFRAENAAGRAAAPERPPRDSARAPSAGGARSPAKASARAKSSTRARTSARARSTAGSDTPDGTRPADEAPPSGGTGSAGAPAAAGSPGTSGPTDPTDGTPTAPARRRSTRRTTRRDTPPDDNSAQQAR